MQVKLSKTLILFEFSNFYMMLNLVWVKVKMNQNFEVVEAI